MKRNIAGLLKRINKHQEKVGFSLALLCAMIVVVLTAGIIYFIGVRGITIFIKDGIGLHHFILGSQWWPDRPVEEGGPLVGVLPFILGSLAVSLSAVLISAPLSIIVAVFMVEIAPEWCRRVLQPAVELLTGIPSVVYGYVGLSVVVPVIRNHLGGYGFSVLAGFVVLSVMILPTITSVSVDTLRALPLQWKEAAFSLGSTRWQTIRMVLVPAARSGLITGIVLGLARAFGEALAVQMVIGNTRAIPSSFLDPVITLTSAITMDMGYTVMGSLWNNVLWSMGLLLLIISFIFIVVIKLISRRGVVVR
ncbi:MAG: phosphate ABC transporter permease subunit PstC [Firmicutes bacterium]|nr:phosphate ABC transporter permease subunit PstC [Bacillota bacterium]MCL5056823.1 phosphate ABC transporter permease subunit PstC [Actinomycetota bacterium]